MERGKLKIIIESNFDNKDIVISLNYSEERTAPKVPVQEQSININNVTANQSHGIPIEIKRNLYQLSKML